MLFRFLDFETSPIANEEDGKIVLLVVLQVKKVRQIYFGLEAIREVWIHGGFCCSKSPELGGSCEADKCNGRCVAFASREQGDGYD